MNVTPLSDCGLSISEPNLSAELESGSADTGPHANENLKGEAEAVYRVVQNVNPSDPQYLTLKVDYIFMSTKLNINSKHFISFQY